MFLVILTLQRFSPIGSCCYRHSISSRKYAHLSNTDFTQLRQRLRRRRGLEIPFRHFSANHLAAGHADKPGQARNCKKYTQSTLPMCGITRNIHQDQGWRRNCERVLFAFIYERTRARLNKAINYNGLCTGKLYTFRDRSWLLVMLVKCSNRCWGELWCLAGLLAMSLVSNFDVILIFSFNIDYKVSRMINIQLTLKLKIDLEIHLWKQFTK